MYRALQAWPMAWLADRPQMEFWVYRASAFALLNVMDDPAWLALMFC